MKDPVIWIHWLHLMAAIFWVGGMLFLGLVAGPALRGALPPAERLRLIQGIGDRFHRFQPWLLGILVATGGYRLWTVRDSPDLFRGAFGTILLVKLALFGAMIVLTHLHTHSWGPRLMEMGPSHPEFPRLSRKIGFWGRVNVLIAVGIVLCGVLLRFSPW